MRAQVRERLLNISVLLLLVRPAQSRAVLPAMKPGTARAFASRRRAHSRAPGPESLSLGSLGDSSRLPKTETTMPPFRSRRAALRSR